jgi:uncharacterized protein (TIGR00255 family)
VDVTVRIEPLAGSDRPRLDRVLAEEAVAAARTLGEEFGVEGRLDVTALLGIPGLLAGAPVECRWDAELQKALETTLGTALAALDEERLREGRHLQQDLQSRVAHMGQLVLAMRGRAEKLPATARERLIERLRGLAPEVVLDPARLAQEAALLAERSDVTEELVRLDGHLEQATRLLGEPDGEPLGKRMDFLLQEIQRETNTVNSKASDLELGRLALELKGEIEKVREQVQNVE